MAISPDFRTYPRASAATTAAVVDAGLRAFMLRVYNFMLAGIGISGLVVYLAVATGFYQQIAGTPLIWIVVLAPPGAVLFLRF